MGNDGRELGRSAESQDDHLTTDSHGSLAFAGFDKG